MEEKDYVIFVIVSSAAFVALMITAVADLLLLARNRKLKHRNELLEMNARFENEIQRTRHEATDQVFNDIAAELHDNIGQTLTLAVMQLNRAEQKELGREAISKARDVVRQAIQDVRHLSHDISSDYWRNFDLKISLERMKESINRSGNVQLETNLYFNGGFVSKDNEVMVLRILQEMINNSLKHSGANTISLDIRELEGQMHIAYKDNGKGFNTGDNIKGMGLTTINNRLSLLKAEWNIDTGLGKGFKLQAAIPNTIAYEQ